MSVTITSKHEWTLAGQPTLNDLREAFTFFSGLGAKGNAEIQVWSYQSQREGCSLTITWTGTNPQPTEEASE